MKDLLNNIQIKAKYVRCEGSSGNYTYFYNEPKKDGSKKNTANVPERYEKVIKKPDELNKMSPKQLHDHFDNVSSKLEKDAQISDSEKEAVLSYLDKVDAALGNSEAETTVVESREEFLDEQMEDIQISFMEENQDKWKKHVKKEYQSYKEQAGGDVESLTEFEEEAQDDLLEGFMEQNNKEFQKHVDKEYEIWTEDVENGRG